MGLAAHVVIAPAGGVATVHSFAPRNELVSELFENSFVPIIR